MISKAIYEHYKEIQDIKVRSLKEPAIVIDPSYSVSKVINTLSKKNAYDAFCINGKSIQSTNLRSLLGGKDIVDMIIEPFLFSIPSVGLNETLQKAANILSHYRVRAVPIVEKGKIVGQVTAKKIIQLLAKKDNKWITANLLYTKNPITINSDDSLSTARKLMYNKRIDHLPVLKKGNVSQVLTSFHLVDTLNPHESLGRKSVGMKKIRNLESKIGNIGSTRIRQCGTTDNLNQILNAMIKNDTSCCLVHHWGNLQGIITYRDILSLLAVKLEADIPLYIIGMPEDQKSVNLITSKFNQTLKLFQKTHSDIQEARISIKQKRSGRQRTGKFEISFMVITDHTEPRIYTEVGYDLSQMIESLSRKLSRNITKGRKRRNKLTVRKINLPIARV